MTAALNSVNCDDVPSHLSALQSADGYLTEKKTEKVADEVRMVTGNRKFRVHGYQNTSVRVLVAALLISHGISQSKLELPECHGNAVVGAISMHAQYTITSTATDFDIFSCSPTTCIRQHRKYTERVAQNTKKSSEKV